MSSVLYVMDGDKVRPAHDEIEFSTFMGKEEKKLLLEDDVYGIYQIRTTFLGKVPSNYKRNSSPGKPQGSKRSRPILFHTIVFGLANDKTAERWYDSYQEAMAGHKEILKTAKTTIQ